MGKSVDILSKAFRGSRLVFLFAFLAVVIFHGIWWYDRFHMSALLWLVPLWSMPWWSWSLPIIDNAPRYLQPSLQAASMAFGFAFNSAAAYTLVRAGWLATRPNNSFKPNALRSTNHMAG